MPFLFYKILKPDIYGHSKSKIFSSKKAWTQMMASSLRMASMHIRLEW